MLVFHVSVVIFKVTKTFLSRKDSCCMFVCYWLRIDVIVVVVVVVVVRLRSYVIVWRQQHWMMIVEML